MSRREATMRAAVIHEPGGPEVLKLEEVPLPSPEEGQVLIRVKAFGLNRSELFTRRGLVQQRQVALQTWRDGKVVREVFYHG